MRAIQFLLALVWTGLLVTTGCDGDREDEQLAGRVAALEARLADEIELSELQTSGSQVYEVAIATARVDGLDLVGLTQRLGAREAVRATDVGEVTGAARAMKHVRWPLYLQRDADDLIELLDPLGEALAGRDVERAARLAPQALATKDQLLLKTDGWLQAVDPWSRRSQPGHDHGEVHADHEPRHGGLLGMNGDLHLELAAVDPATFRVYLSDAIREPLDASGVSGSLVLHADTDRETTLAWRRAGIDFFEARGEPQQGDEVLASVRLQGTPEGAVVMDFLLPLRREPQPPPAGVAPTAPGSD